MPMLPQLPPPSPDALAVSQALTQLIKDEIVQADGWISFARFMELALYTPQLGYYSGGSQKLGQDGDFTTAPEMSSHYGQAIAHAMAPLLTQTLPHIMEFGAGSGKLARDILTELMHLGITIAQYTIIDLSGELRSRQQSLLSDFKEVVWSATMPEAFSGVIIGNEVLDAMPIQLVIKSPSGWCERGVTYLDNHFTLVDRPCDVSLIDAIPHADDLPIGYTTEVHHQAQAFMASIADMCVAGQKKYQQGSVAIFIDYGFKATEFYLHERSNGTLMCHYRHYAHADPFYLPGLQDITAHVNFTSVAQAAINNELDILAYCTQAAFLLNAGIGDLLLRASPSDPLLYLPQANAVHKLLSPAEMGELFKVLIVGVATTLHSDLLKYNRNHYL